MYRLNPGRLIPVFHRRRRHLHSRLNHKLTREHLIIGQDKSFYVTSVTNFVRLCRNSKIIENQIFPIYFFHISARSSRELQFVCTNLLPNSYTILYVHAMKCMHRGACNEVHASRCMHWGACVFSVSLIMRAKTQYVLDLTPD